MNLKFEKTKMEKGYENTLEISVKYNPNSQEIELVSIVSAERKYWENGNTVHFSGLTSRHDITDVMLAAFPKIEDEIAALNWEQIYHEQRHESFVD